VQHFLSWGDLASKQEERRAMTLQQAANRALSILAVRHLVAERLKTKPEPAAKRAFALFQDEARETADSFRIHV
jgi:hypothetical protein